MTSGVEFKFLALRVTDTNGCDFWPVKMFRRGSIRLTPSIVSGHGRTMDTFHHWDIELTVPWWRGVFLRRILRNRVTLEFWTESEDDYVHWLFPYTSWKRRGWARFQGRTHDGEGVTRPDIPDGLPISSGGFWKVTEVP